MLIQIIWRWLPIQRITVVRPGHTSMVLGECMMDSAVGVISVEHSTPLDIVPILRGAYEGPVLGH